MRRLVVGVAVTLVLLAGLARPAAADPVNSPRSVQITLNCDGSMVLVVINGGGLTPRLIVDSTSVLVPLFLTLTVTDTVTGEVLFSGTIAGPHGVDREHSNLPHVTCSDVFTDVDPDTGHTLLVDFASEDLLTPSH